MGIISWLIFGALAGWVASMIAGSNREQNWLGNIVVGIVGAFIGGFLWNLLTGGGVSGLNIGSIVLAIVGSLILLAGYRMIASRRAT